MQLVKNHLSFIVIVLMLTACASSKNNFLKVENDLEQWIDEILVPDLSHVLNNHPRLKHQPFIIVAMENDDTLSKINGLSTHIRTRLQEGLRAAPGAKLMWQPGRFRRQHHRSLEKVKCEGLLQRPIIQIGIDSQISALTGQLRVSIKAVDLIENRWITGFGYQWQANATEMQIRALSKTSVDEVQRGLRELPFSSGDADLLASYLAHNLSCVLREVRDDRITIYVSNPQQVPQFIITAINLVDNYLDQFNEVDIADSEEMANFILKTEAHDLNNGLYQIWAKIIRQANDLHVGGAITQTYVKLDSPTLAYQKHLIDESVSPITASNLVNSSKIIEQQSVDLNIITPPYQSLCQTTNPWLQGAKKLSNEDQLPSHGCFAIEFTPYHTDRLVVLLHDSEGQLHRLLPNQCTVVGLSHIAWKNENSTRIPYAKGVTGVFDFELGSGTESVYVLSSDSNKKNSYINELVKNVPEFCDGSMPYFIDKVEFQQQIKNRSVDNDVNWTVAMVNHN